jgi:anti-sigma factor RsiW
MTCDEVKKELALRLVGLGAPEKSGEVEAHARACPVCAESLEKVLGVEKTLAVDRPAGNPDFEASWRIIESRSLGRTRKPAFPSLNRRWALAGAVIAVFALGALAGRIFLSSGRRPLSAGKRNCSNISWPKPGR